MTHTDVETSENQVPLPNDLSYSKGLEVEGVTRFVPKSVMLKGATTGSLLRSDAWRSPGEL